MSNKSKKSRRRRKNYCEWVRIRYYCDSGWFVWFFVKKLNRNNRVQGLIGTWSGNSAWQPIKIVLKETGGVALTWVAPRPQRQWNISEEENDELWLFLTIFAWNFRILLWLLHPSFYYFAPAFSLVVKLYDFGLIRNSNRFIRGSNPRFDYDFVLFYVHKARLPKQRTAL